MKTTINLIIATSMIVSVAPEASSQPEDLDEGFNFECEFDKHYAVSLREDKAEKYSKGVTRLTIIDDVTSNRTLSLDGAVRATNSRDWTLVKSFDFERAYVGDAGDLVTIYYRPDDSPNRHIASLQWGTILGYAYTSMGVCFAS